jgi:hypothetical protein
MYQTVEQLMREGVSASRLWWLRLDHPILLQHDLGSLVKSVVEADGASVDSPSYLFLDEITYAENWDLWLKTMYDEQWPVRIVGTSSATAAIRERGAESGVGRWDEQYLAPYLFTEFLDLREDDPNALLVSPQTSLGKTLDSLIARGVAPPRLSELRRRYMITGGFPELLAAKSSDDEASDLFRSQRILRSDAIEKAVYKDIPQAFNIQDPAKLERLLYTLAGQMTGLFSPATLATDVQLNAKTLERYTTFLERAFILFTLPNYAPTEESVQRRGRKIYFVDGAVRNAALLRGLAPLQDPQEMGLLVENLVAAHLNSLSQQSGVRLYHWRRRRSEVDIVYDHPDEPLAFEVTVAGKHTQKGLLDFQQRFPRFRGRCYVVSPDAPLVRPTDGEVGYMPLDLLLLAIGRQAHWALERRTGVRRASDGQLRLFEDEKLQ